MNIKSLVLLAAVSFLRAPSAEARARLQQSSPAKGATLELPPEEVTARFSETLDLKLCRLSAKDADSGSIVSTGELTNVGEDPKTLRIALKELPRNGTHRYRVNWQAAAEHARKAQGSFTFSVGSAKPFD